MGRRELARAVELLAGESLHGAARLLAFSALEPTGLLPAGAKVEQVLTGVVFEEGGITNFVEENFLT